MRMPQAVACATDGMPAMTCAAGTAGRCLACAEALLGASIPLHARRAARHGTRAGRRSPDWAADGGRGQGGHLDDGEAEGLLQGHIGEDAARGKGQAVDVGNVGLGVLLGVGHAAIQVVGIHQAQHLLQHLGAACRHAINVVAVALRVGTDAVISMARCHASSSTVQLTGGSHAHVCLTDRRRAALAPATA